MIGIIFTTTHPAFGPLPRLSAVVDEAAAATAADAANAAEAAAATAAGEFKAEPVLAPRGDNSDIFDVGFEAVLGLAGCGDCVAIGTEALRCV